MNEGQQGSATPPTKIKMCGLWRKTTANNVTYLTGSLTQSSTLMVFPNNYKREGSNDPDYLLWMYHRDKEQSAPQPQVQSYNQQFPPAFPPAQQSAPVQQVPRPTQPQPSQTTNYHQSSDEIPF